MDERIRLSVGPASSDVAREWILNRKQLVDAVHRSSTVAAKADVLDLLETFLDLWLVETSKSDTFDWTYEMQVDVLLLIANYWLNLGELTPEQRAAMGVPPAPAETDAFTLLVVRGMTDALRSAGPGGQAVLDRLGI